MSCNARTLSGKPCRKNAVKDGFCERHHPDIVAGRRERSRALADARAQRAAAGPLSIAQNLLEANRRLAERVQQLESRERMKNAHLAYLADRFQRAGLYGAARAVDAVRLNRHPAPELGVQA